jgi:polyisoprenoid-binding protein YceI
MIRPIVIAAPLTLAAAFALAAPPLNAATYTLEPDYTQGVFRWDHLGFSSPAAQFGQGTGSMDFDAANPAKSSVTVTIPLASLNTGVPALDDDFRSTDFFDTAKFPTATFTSTKVEKGAMESGSRSEGVCGIPQSKGGEKIAAPRIRPPARLPLPAAAPPAMQERSRRAAQ